MDGSQGKCIGGPRARVLGRSTVTERNPAGKWREKFSPSISFCEMSTPFSLARSVRVRLQSETKVIMTNFILDQLPIRAGAGEWEKPVRRCDVVASIFTFKLREPRVSARSSFVYLPRSHGDAEEFVGEK